MVAPFERRHPQPDEREICALSHKSGVPLGQVRLLFSDELARLGMGAKVDSYLAVLTASNVRGMLQRRTRLKDAARRVFERTAARTSREHRHLHRWEDDGGRSRQTPEGPDRAWPGYASENGGPNPAVTMPSRADPFPS